MAKKEITGITIAIIGSIMAIFSLGIFSGYYLLSPPWGVQIRMIPYNLISAVFRLTSFPSIILPISSILMLIFGLLFVFWGLLFSWQIVIFIILMLIFALLSVFLGLGFFFYPIYQFHFFSLYPLLILISGLIYIANSFFLFRLKNRNRKLIICYSIILAIYFFSLLICFIVAGAWRDFFGGAIAFSLLPYIIFPLFFIIFFTRHKIKEQFKK